MKNYNISIDELNNFVKLAKEIISSDKFQVLKNFYAHGSVSVYKHSIRVALMSYFYAIKKKYLLNYQSLVRGALLHDYYLYDWHKNKKFTFHGLKHSKIALKNASRDFILNKTEKNIILSHMFPLTLFHFPKCKEAMIVCKMDKISAIQENKIRRKVNEQIV